MGGEGCYVRVAPTVIDRCKPFPLGDRLIQVWLYYDILRPIFDL